MSDRRSNENRYIVRPLETGNDRFRISVFAKQRMKSAGFDVRSSLDDRGETILEVEGVENVEELEDALPQVDMEKGKKIDYDINRVSEENNGANFEEELDELKEDYRELEQNYQKLEDWARKLLEEKERLEERPEVRMAESDDLFEHSTHYFSLFGKDLEDLEPDVAGIIDTDTREVFQMLYRDEAEYIAEQLDRSSEDIEVLLEQEREDQNLERVLELSNQFQEASEGREHLENEISSSVEELETYEVGIFNRSDRFEIYFPVGGDTGALSNYLAMKISNYFSELYDEGIYSGSQQDNILRLELQKTGDIDIRQVEEQIKELTDQEVLSDLEKRIYRVEDVEEDKIISFDEFYEIVIETQGWGDSLAERVVNQIREMDYNDPVSAYRSEPSRIMNLSGISQERYFRVLEKL